MIFPVEFRPGDPVSAGNLEALRRVAMAPVVGSGGVQVRNNGRSRVITNNGSPAQYLFQINSSLARGTTGGTDDDVLSATGRLWVLNIATNEYFSMGSAHAVKVYFPFLPLWATFAVTSGDLVHAFPDRGSGRWESPLRMRENFVCKLPSSTTISAGSTGTMNLVRADGTAVTDPLTSSQVQFTVRNIGDSELSGTGKFPVFRDAFGDYVTRPAAVVVSATTRYRGVLASAITGSTSTVTVNSLVALDGPGGLSSLTAHNVHGWTMDSGVKVRVEYNATDEQWELYQGDCNESVAN